MVETFLPSSRTLSRRLLCPGWYLPDLLSLYLSRLLPLDVSPVRYYPVESSSTDIIGPENPVFSVRGLGLVKFPPFLYITETIDPSYNPFERPDFPFDILGAESRMSLPEEL